MRKELTIEHWTAYLPYTTRVKVLDPDRRYPHKRLGVFRGGILSGVTDNPCEIEVRLDNSYDGSSDFVGTSDCKLLLRPLSQLTETIEHRGERFVPSEWLPKARNENAPIPAMLRGVYPEFMPYKLIRQLHEWHFDTFGLIESGLAEPIPSIEQQ
jgi:hypothetical protein